MDEFALVYEAAAARGISMRECDESEIVWLAAALGANRPDEDDPLVDGEGWTFNQRRAIAAAKGEPLPTFDDEPLSPKERADLLRLSQGAQVLMPPTVEGG